MTADLQAFVAKHRELLRQERNEEVQQLQALLRTRPAADLEARGILLRKLAVADLEPAFGGGVQAVLRPSRGGELPAHRFGAGDVVALQPPGDFKDDTAVGTGVVARARADALTVVLDDDEVELPPVVQIVRLVPDVTFRRQEAALLALLQQRPRDEARLLEVCFGQRPPEAASIALPAAWFDPQLDASQRAAVAHALAARELALIHGPPGTGKTTAVVEVIRHAVARRLRVLAAAPSNVAVDNLAERLLAAGLRIVRLGQPARLLPTVAAHSLSALVAADPEQRLIKDVKAELDLARRRLARAGRAERPALRDQLRQLRQEQRTLETAIVRGILDTADVVLATTTGAGEGPLGARRFDLVVVDEAAQAVEAASWIPLLRGNKAVLAGDHRQLPPTILSLAAARGGLATTLFDRLANGPLGAQVTRMLTVQYRMHWAIQAWSSATFYGGALEPAAQVRAHLLRDLPGVADDERTGAPLWFLDTAGCGCDESAGDADESRSNPGEAAHVQRHVEALLAAGVRAADIAVLSPYNAQVQLLRVLLAPHQDLEIGTVDALQGREQEAVVVSLVRSNDRGEVGFLAELRRLNVALTRARRHLCVVGDSATLACDAGLASMVEHLQRHGEHRSAFG